MRKVQTQYTVVIGDYSAKVGKKKVGKQSVGNYGIGSMNIKGEMYGRISVKELTQNNKYLFQEAQQHAATRSGPGKALMEKDEMK